MAAENLCSSDNEEVCLYIRYECKEKVRTTPIFKNPDSLSQLSFPEFKYNALQNMHYLSSKPGLEWRLSFQDGEDDVDLTPGKYRTRINNVAMT